MIAPRTIQLVGVIVLFLARGPAKTTNGAQEGASMAALSEPATRSSLIRIVPCRTHRRLRRMMLARTVRGRTMEEHRNGGERPNASLRITPDHSRAHRMQPP